MITKSNWGGAQKYVYELSKSLKQTDQYEIIVAFGGNGILCERLKELNIKTYELKTLDNSLSMLKTFSNIKEINAILKKEQPDIVHLNSSKIGYLGAFCGRFFSDAKIIFTSHGWPHNEDRPKIIKFILWFLMGTTLVLSHKSIAVSKKIEEEAPFKIFVKNKLKQIYFGINPTKTLSREEAREKLNIDNNSNKLEIVTIAELNKNKGYSYSLLAIRNLIHNDKANIKYHIIGGGEDEEKIKQTIKKYHLEFDVVVHGFIKDAAKYMPAFDLFLLTSTTEALGYVLLEAGFSGLPIVATDVGGIPEVIKNKKTGLLAETKNWRDIKDKISTLIENKELREELSKNLKEEIDKEFLFQKTVHETTSLYKSLLK